MGFGLLFLGLSLVLAMTAYGVLPSFIGFFLCMYACFRLEPYDAQFGRCAWAMGGVGCYFMGVSALQLVLLIGKNTLLSDFAENLQPVTEAVFYFSQLCLLLALSSIAAETGRTRTARACKRNIVIYILLFALYIAANVLVSRGWEYSRYCLLYLTLSRFLVLVMTMVQVFACYMWICREGEEEEEQREAESRLNRRFTKRFRHAPANETVKEEEEPKWIRDKKRKKRR